MGLKDSLAVFTLVLMASLQSVCSCWQDRWTGGSCAALKGSAVVCRTRLQELLLHGPQPQQPLGRTSSLLENGVEASHASTNGRSPVSEGGPAPSKTQNSSDAAARGIACKLLSIRSCWLKPFADMVTVCCEAAVLCQGVGHAIRHILAPSQQHGREGCEVRARIYILLMLKLQCMQARAARSM